MLRNVRRGTVIARFLPRGDEDASHADGRPIRQRRISATCGRDELPDPADFAGVKAAAHC
jgi:hypothetical protein